MQKPSKHSNFQMRFTTLEKWRKQNMRVVVSRTASNLNTFGTKNHLSEEAGKSFVPIISDSALTGVSQPLFSQRPRWAKACLSGVWTHDLPHGKASVHFVSFMCPFNSVTEAASSFKNHKTIACPSNQQDYRPFFVGKCCFAAISFWTFFGQSKGCVSLDRKIIPKKTAQRDCLYNSIE